MALFLALPLAAAAQSPIPDGAEPERIANGFQFTEGPLWVDDGLLFSDIPANTVYRWTPDGGVEVAIQPSQKSNGLALDTDGVLLLAQHGARRVARRESDGSETALATAYEGDALNSPNDIAVHPDGSIYFTDPTWGLEGRPAELDFTGVYRLAPDGTLTLLTAELHQPNGIAFSPDLSTLYVTTSDQRTVEAYDLVDGEISNRRQFARLTGGTPSDAADGLVVDAQGRLYVTGPRGLWVFAPDGTTLDVIDVPDQTTNVTFGPDSTLYITSGPGVYRLMLERSTSSADSPVGLGLRIESVQPNPSTGSATLGITVATARTMTVTVVDMLGRTVRALDLGTPPIGEHSVEIDLNDLPTGRYAVRVDDGNATASRVLTIVR